MMFFILSTIFGFFFFILILGALLSWNPQILAIGRKIRYVLHDRPQNTCLERHLLLDSKELTGGYVDALLASGVWREKEGFFFLLWKILSGFVFPYIFSRSANWSCIYNSF